MEMIVKCGEKERHLLIPEGYYKLGEDEITKEGDLVANIRKLYWMPIESDPEDIGFKAGLVGDHVIRKTAE